MAGITKAERARRKHTKDIEANRAEIDSAPMDSLHDLANHIDAEMLHDRFNRLIARYEAKIANARETVEKFADDILNRDAAYSFEWADSAVASSAEIAVYREFVSWTHAKGPWVALEHANEKAIEMARVVHSSTSACHNLVSAYRTASWAYIVDDRRWTYYFD